MRTAKPNSRRLSALAAGVVQEFAPEEVVRAAGDAGFNAVGIWCDLETWNDKRTHAVQQALIDTNITALDIEVVWFRPGDKIDAHDRIVDIAQTLNVHNILCVSSEPDISVTKQRFADMCELAEGSAIRVVLEFLAITEINNLARALEVVQDVGHPAGGILVDALHLRRTGSTVQDVAELTQAGSLLPYVQLCDATLELKDTSPAGVLEDAVHLRTLPGQGELPLTDLISAVGPEMPISWEIRSRQLTVHYPDLSDRAKAVYSATQAFLNSIES